jgi:hypothetical protein
MRPRAALTLLAITAVLLAQPIPSMKQLMLDLIHPASNDILVTISRGGPDSEKDWATLRHSALTLQQSAEALLRQNAAAPWQQSAKLLSDAASDTYRAAQAKDAKALFAIPARIDTACTNCHKQYRPNVFPPPEGRVE